MKKALLILFIVFFYQIGFSQCVWDGGGAGNNWGTANNWGGDCDGAVPDVNDRLPTAGDDVIIAADGAAVTVTVNGDFSCANLTLDADGEVITLGQLGIGYAATLTVATGNTLTVGGSTLIRNYHADGTITDATGEATLTIDDGAVFDSQTETMSFDDLGDNVQLGDVPTVNVSGILRIATIDFNNIGADFVLDNAAAEDNTLELYGSGNPISQYAGSFSVGANENYIIYKSHASGQTISDDLNYGNLVVEGNSSNVTTIPSGGLTNVVGTADSLVIRSGGILDIVTYTLDGPAGTSVFHIEDDGELRLSGASNFPVQFNTYSFEETSTVLYEGATQDVAAEDYGNLILDQAGVKTLQGNSNPTGNVTVSNGATFDVETFDLTGAAGKTLDINDGCRLALSGANNFPTGFGTFEFNTSSTVDYDLNGAQTVAIHDYANLDITGGGTKTLAVGTAGVVALLDIEDGATLATSLAGGQFLRLISTGDAAAETAKIANLDDESTGTLSGDGFICERDMDLANPDAVGWNDWASPIENFRLASWYYAGWPMTGVGGIRGSDFPSNPFCSVLTYDANISVEYDPFDVQADTILDRNDGWVRAPSITTNFNPGTGFRIYTGARNRVLSDIGLPDQGTVVVNLNYTDEATAVDDEEGWNLVGNPYMCTVDFDDLTRTASVDNSMWMYSNVNSGYYAYNTTAGTANAPFDVLDNTTITDGLIPSHKAFWVKVSAAAQTLTFNEDDKNTGGVAYIKSNNEELPKIRVQVQNLANGFLSAGVSVFNSNASASFDSFDTEIFKSGNASAPNLYFLSEDNRALSINGTSNDVNVLPIKIEAGVSGDFELKFYDFAEMPSGTCLMLQDKLTDEWFNLRETQSIVRELYDTTSFSRFAIHLNRILGAELVENVSCFGANNGEILVENLTEEGPIGLGLYNEAGQLIKEAMVTDAKVWSDLAPGAYTVREVNTTKGCPGAFDEVVISEPVQIIPDFLASESTIDLATHSGEVSFANESEGATDYIWFFSDNNEFSYEANPTHTYTTPGIHTVSLLAHNGNYDCAKVREQQIEVKSSVGIAEELLPENNVNAYIQHDEIVLNLFFEQQADVQVQLLDVTGKTIDSRNYQNVVEQTNRIAIPHASGVYVLKVQSNNKQRSIKLFK